ncbi:trypsin-like peptidase domain-containing protein [Streptomyces sp. Z26]|uniref:S1C family serine protease n=1 Tax=Streptomyces sp. Z26 TaxID=2500177 RepID=UPI000EF134A0|nr:trypsin-like peptidase domain-containing protein [Streptomyces sp. Z26]RLL67503.1 serine protease [Streptomyces sp. Z26]
MNAYDPHRPDPHPSDAQHPGAVPPPPEQPPVPPHAAWPPPAAPAPAPPRHRARRPGALLAAVAVVAALVGGGTGALVEGAYGGGSDGGGGSSAASVTQTSARNGSVGEVAESVSPSVVEINATSAEGESTGSGVVITKDGEILTNNHVVAGSDKVQVTFENGKKVTGDVVGTDPDLDMALVKVDGVSGLKPAPLGDSDRIGVGDEVVAFGSPEGLTGTVTSGIISAKDREVKVQKESGGSGQGGGGQDGRWPFEFGGGRYNGDVGTETTTYKALQTDASLNPGNSGGPLVNMAGQVVGINSAMYGDGGDGASGSQASSAGLGFAIPVNAVKQVLGELRAGND